ncbi:alpha/beta fold hydrolase [Pontibacillus sp. ALD_SL1]|uniref:alpha/beta hydrolase n=1 Tax=Pontibacillus sp. ALD_SL1 TaxID=2777185 RepID=UPI001A97ACF9|nr:alpha/beta fold hydrolase [Pontibacillus sp. ALD_SL1]QST00593.1 alpha/beta fold hydrolase [Pontibacillus sp. ALD_SL1]
MAVGCLFIHGFGGAPYELEPLYKEIEEHSNWELKIPILPGHNEDESLKEREYMDWVHKAENDLRKLKARCDTVYIIGYSMGGVIAAYLSTIYKVDKLVLLSTSAHYIDISQIAKDLWKMAKDGIRGDLLENDLFHRYIRRMGNAPASASLQFQKLVGEFRPYFKQVTTPTLILQGGEDGLLPPKSARYIYNSIQVTEKTLHFLPQSKHMVCHGPDQSDLIDMCFEFLDHSKRTESY